MPSPPPFARLHRLRAADAAAPRRVVAQKHYGMINSLKFIDTGLQAVALLRFEIKQFRIVVLGKGIIKRNSSIPFIYSWARPSSGLSDQRFNLQDDERMIPRFDRRSRGLVHGKTWDPSKGLQHFVELSDARGRSASIGPQQSFLYTVNAME